MAINKRLINTSGEAVVVPTSFNTILWEGNNSVAQTITGMGFTPDLVWSKQINGTASHRLLDSVRGDGRYLYSNLTNSEDGYNSDYMRLASDGVLLPGADSNFGTTNTWVGWGWKAGGAAVTNTDGSITSEVSANVDAGFSVVKFTQSGLQTIGHGLDEAPKMVITKSTNVVGNWHSYHEGLDLSSPEDYFIVLNLTEQRIFNTTLFNSVKPTNSVFSFNYSGSSTAFIAYCFAEKAGFSKIGSYTGNGSATGPTVTTDFEPAFVMIKRTDSTGNWVILDNKRDTSNPIDKTLNPNLSAAESTANDIDFNATTFQLKSTNADTNANTSTYIYMAFANQF